MSGDPYDQPGSNFSFVILSPQDISEWIASYEVSVSVEELAKPTPQTVETVYTLLIELYKNVTTEDQENMKLKMLEHQENQVSTCLNGNPPFFFTLFLFTPKHSTRMAEIANVSLTFQDLTRPEPRRTIRIVSGLINLVKFRQSQMPEVLDLKSANEQSFERRDRAVWEKAQAEGRLKDYKAERAAEQPEVDQLKEKILAIKNELPGLQKGYQKANEARTALKKEQLALVQRVQKLNEMIIAKSERNDELRARLVDDPELFQKNIREATEALNNIRQLVAAEEAKSRDLKTRLDWLGSVETDVALAAEVSKTVVAERARWTEADKALREIELDLNKRVIDHREMSTKRDHLSRQLEHTTEKYTRAQRHGEESRVQAEATAQQLREAYDQGLKERSATSEKAEEVRRMVAEVEAQIIGYVAEEERLLNEMITTYSTFRDRTEHYIDNLTKRLSLRTAGQHPS
ncbi:putative kinetochore protein NUF2 [Rhizoctonia solani AG-1 IB]|uniref:Putative kinetochore protein NUF2 n=1 Tax=Thanatephorus cucumeris (strain AG1-IB / isolate 7/3/14) TaxID=1108050 RepID=M5C698_THACB|nr:putative kinetochore protein NUF2 [Rhizoctonia solani AG-1 IB]